MTPIYFRFRYATSGVLSLQASVQEGVYTLTVQVAIDGGRNVTVDGVGDGGGVGGVDAGGCAVALCGFGGDGGFAHSSSRAVGLDAKLIP